MSHACRRWPGIVASCLSLLVLGGLLAEPGVAQKATKPDEGEAPAKKPVKKTPKGEEEEEPVKPKLKPPLRVEDDDPTTKGTIGSKAVDLAREAELAKHAAVRDLYRRLAVPHDEISFPVARATLPVLPLPEYVGPRPEFAGKIAVDPLDAKGKPLDKTEQLTAKQIKAVDHYEAIAVRETERFFERVKDAADLPRLEALQHGERALAEVLRYHQAALLNRQRGGPNWNTLEKALRDKLRGVRLNQLRTLAEAREWDGVKELIGQLTETYPNHPEVNGVILKVRGQQVLLSLDEKKVETYIAARQGLEQLERQYSDSQQEEVIQKVRERLQARAGVSLRAARDLAKRDKTRAIAELRTVENVWPQLPGLLELRQELRLFRPLGVGVRQLPQLLSPATAVTDAEKQAGELLFESLLRPVHDAQVGTRYEPVLAVAAPRMVPLGRQFQLPGDARWYRAPRGSQETAIEEPVTAADVFRTVTLYQNAKGAGRSPEWDDLLAGAAAADDPFRVRLTLRQGYLDPLSLMTFKILPAKYLGRPDDEAFARDPIGSGPYQYLGVKGDSRGGEYAQFLANPVYGNRAGKSETPRVGAIHFFRSKDPVADFKAGNLHMLLDLPTPEIKKLTDPAAGVKDVSVTTLRNRRVHFLAVNHRDKKLQNEEWRRALAHAIDRDAILTNIFRDGQGAGVHRPLNGPYPSGSWACDPSLPADPYNYERAKFLAKKSNAPEVELLYPNDLAGVEDACKSIADQAQLCGIRLKLRGAPQREVHRAVALDHQYELAYWHWDHASDTYWLGPLLDPRAAERGGPNVLGRLNDADLEGLLTQALGHRDFAEVQRLTRLIHNRLYQKMPLIPLWQLDTHIAIHADVKLPVPAAQLDPLLVFTQVDRWELAK